MILRSWNTNQKVLWREGASIVKLRCAYLGWGLEEASLIDLASWPGQSNQDWKTGIVADRKGSSCYIFLANLAGWPRTKMAASRFQTFKAL